MNAMGKRLVVWGAKAFFCAMAVAMILGLPGSVGFAHELDDEEGDRVGWEEIQGNWYFYRDDGRIKKGWLEEDGELYYLDQETGIRCTGWKTIGKGLYHFDRKGRADTGWKKKGQNTYFLLGEGGIGERGRAATGWQIIHKKRYCFAPDGAMYVGRAVCDGDVYYFKPSGEQRTGWVDEGEGFGRYYYKKSESFKQWGKPVKNRFFKGRYFLKTGATSPNAKSCEMVLNSLGWDLRNAYEWARTLSYSGRTIYTEQMGSAALATQGFEKRTGNCFVKAGTFYEMARVLGYDAHQISGAVVSRSGGFSVHSWVEFDEEDGVWVYDPVELSDEVDRFHFQYGKPGTWKYAAYHRMN